MFAIVREWHRQGKPRTNDTRHDFRAWAQTLDWIVQNLLKATPLMEGHRETQQRMTNPALNWLREVALIVIREKRSGQSLMASDLLDLLEEDSSIEIPGLREGADPSDDKVRRSVLQQIGRKLGRCYKDQNTLSLDGILIGRSRFKDEESRPRWQYNFSRNEPCYTPPNSFGQAQTDKALSRENTPVGGHELSHPTNTPPDSPLITPLINPREPPNPPIGSGKAYMRARDSADSILTRYGPVRGLGGLAGSQTDEKTPSLARCTNCNSTEFLDIPIHDGRSVRRDCVKCGHTLTFPIWEPAQES